jgi:hypothetical protein
VCAAPLVHDKSRFVATEMQVRSKPALAALIGSA